MEFQTADSLVLPGLGVEMWQFSSVSGGLFLQLPALAFAAVEQLCPFLS